MISYIIATLFILTIATLVVIKENVRIKDKGVTTYLSSVDILPTLLIHWHNSQGEKTVTLSCSWIVWSCYITIVYEDKPNDFHKKNLLDLYGRIAEEEGLK